MLYKRLVVRATGVLKPEIPIFVSSSTGPRKGKVRRGIEDYVLSEFNAKKLHKDGYDYELTVRYEDDEDLDEIVYGMLRDMDDEADCRHCFIETDIRSKDGSKSW